MRSETNDETGTSDEILSPSTAVYTLRSKATGGILGTLPRTTATALATLIPALGPAFAGDGTAELAGEALLDAHVALGATLTEWRAADWAILDLAPTAPSPVSEPACQILAAAEELFSLITDGVDPEDEGDGLIIEREET